MRYARKLTPKPSTVVPVCELARRSINSGFPLQLPRWHLSNQYLLSTSITLFNQWCPAKNKPPSKVVRPMPYHIPQFVAGRPSPIFCKHHHKQLYQNNSKQPHKYCVEYEPSYNNSHYYLLPCPLSSIFRY